MTAAKHPPAVLISGSAIGYYGDTGDAVIDESAEANADFGARLCEAWEVEASHAEAAGVRVCTLRTGLVLSASGGMLGQMMTGFRLGLGGRLGNGRQWMSWIHMEDQLGIIEKLLGDASCRGPYNLTAPAPVTNADFTRALARALGRPAFLSVPGAVIKAALGESAYLLLGGQKVLPRRAQAAGYEFRFDDLSTALADLLE